MARILLAKQISNLKTVGFEDVERTINVRKIDIDGDYERIYLGYSISYNKNGVDVTPLFEKKSGYDWYITNDQRILQRDENFQPIPNPDYVEPTEENEGTPHLEPYLYAQAFTMVMDGFDAMMAIPYQILELYIDENDADGKWDIME